MSFPQRHLHPRCSLLKNHGNVLTTPQPATSSPTPSPQQQWSANSPSAARYKPLSRRRFYRTPHTKHHTHAHTTLRLGIFCNIAPHSIGYHITSPPPPLPFFTSPLLNRTRTHHLSIQHPASSLLALLIIIVRRSSFVVLLCFSLAPLPPCKEWWGRGRRWAGGRYHTTAGIGVCVLSSGVPFFFYIRAGTVA